MTRRARTRHNRQEAPRPSREVKSSKRIESWVSSCFAEEGKTSTLKMVKAMQVALDERAARCSGDAQLKQGAARPAGSEREAFALMRATLEGEPKPAKAMKAMVEGLTRPQFEALKTAYWRCMHRCCSRFSNADREEVPAALWLPALQALVHELQLFPSPGSPPEGAPPELASRDTRGRVRLYSSLLLSVPRCPEAEELLDHALDMMVAPTRLRALACHLDWHRVLWQAVRVYPDLLAADVARCLLESSVTLEGGEGSEQMKRIA